MNSKSSRSSQSLQSSAQKFRPYLTAPELLRILGALKKESPPALDLIKYLETFSIKIERGIVSSAYTLDPTIEQKLGLAPAAESLGKPLEELVIFYETFPESRHTLSPAELGRIQEFRYNSDRMSPTEAAEYEKSIGL